MACKLTASAGNFKLEGKRNCELRIANCELRIAKCEMRNAKCELLNSKFEIRNSHFFLLLGDAVEVDRRQRRFRRAEQLEAGILIGLMLDQPVCPGVAA